MKRCGVILGAFLLNAQFVHASDMTGALVVIPIAGGIVGLVIGILVCLFASSRRRLGPRVWFSLPVFLIAGVIVTTGMTFNSMSKHENKVVRSYGKYDPLRGGRVIQIPPNFSASDLERFYIAVTNRENQILSSREFAVALVHQGNSIDQVYMNVYPDIEDREEYTRINREIERLMSKVLESKQPTADATK